MVQKLSNLGHFCLINWISYIHLFSAEGLLDAILRFCDRDLVLSSIPGTERLTSIKPLRDHVKYSLLHVLQYNMRTGIWGAGLRRRNLACQYSRQAERHTTPSAEICTTKMWISTPLQLPLQNQVRKSQHRRFTHMQSIPWGWIGRLASPIGMQPRWHSELVAQMFGRCGKAL